MALHITDPKADRLARELAKTTGESITEVVVKSLEERVSRTEAAREARRLAIMKIVEEFSKLPVLDDRSADEIIGYNEFGHFD